MDNQQGDHLNDKQLQVVLAGILGDGHIIQRKSSKASYMTNCIHEEYLLMKARILSEFVTPRGIVMSENAGYKRAPIFTFATRSSKAIGEVSSWSLEKQLGRLDSFGLAMWLYEDGSLHKKNHFYNINTHSFSKDTHYEILVPYFASKGITAKVLEDRKKDGRVFHYLMVGRHFGAYDFTMILREYYISCYEYKMWPSETTQRWGKLQAELKRQGIEVTPRKFANLLLGKCFIQDIVRTV